jgi:hypothetical protein
MQPHGDMTNEPLRGLALTLRLALRTATAARLALFARALRSAAVIVSSERSPWIRPPFAP